MHAINLGVTKLLPRCVINIPVLRLFDRTYALFKFLLEVLCVYMYIEFRCKGHIVRD
jgi:hypothetical protein